MGCGAWGMGHGLGEQEVEESSKTHKAAVESAVLAVTTTYEERVKTEQSRAARALKEHELIVSELRRELSTVTSAFDKHKRKTADELEAAKRDAQAMHDELDLLKEKAKKLVAAETQLERYKKKLEAVGEVRAALTDSEQQRNTE
jgi:hypothetical protein